MSGLRNSTIETFRKRFHGNSRLRLLALSADGQTYAALGVLEKGFYVGREADTQEGYPYYSAAIDAQYTPALTAQVLRLVAAADLYDPSDLDSYTRFHVKTDTPPLWLDARYVLGMDVVQSDKREVVGTYVPSEESGGGDIVLVRYVHRQAVAATVWTVNHNLGEKPIIDVYTTGGVLMLADVVHISNNQAQITFAAATAGEARCI